MNSLAVKDVDNEVLADADEYLRKHKICELFEVSILDVSKPLFILHSISLQNSFQFNSTIHL